MYPFNYSLIKNYILYFHSFFSGSNIFQVKLNRIKRTRKIYSYNSMAVNNITGVAY